MKRSEKVIFEATEEVRDKVLSLSDDIAFSRYVSSLYEIGEFSSMRIEQITGIGSAHIQNKRRAGGIKLAIEQNGNAGNYPLEDRQASEPYFDKALTREEHGAEGWDESWREAWLDAPHRFLNCPWEFRVKALSEAMDDEGSLILTAMYEDILGRAPDDEGLQWWLARRAEGMGWAELVPAFLAGVSQSDTVR